MFKKWLLEQEEQSFINWAICTNIEDFIPLHLVEFAKKKEDEEKPQYPDFGVLTPGDDNPKTAKNPETKETYMGAVLHLEPYVGSGENTCPWATAIYGIVVSNSSVDSQTLELIKNSPEYEEMADGNHYFLGLEIRLKSSGGIGDTLVPDKACPLIMTIRLPGKSRRDWDTGPKIKLSRKQIVATALVGGCANSCLHSAGNPEYAKAKLSARRRRTEELKTNQPKFMAKILLDVFRLSEKAETQGHRPVIRLNGTSDESWESENYRFSSDYQEVEKSLRENWLNDVGMPMKRIRSSLGDHIAKIVGAPSGKIENLFPYIAKFVSGKTIISAFRQIQWYDYTKDPSRMMRFIRTRKGKRENWDSNYHLTFSLAENNRTMAKEVLREGGNVAVVFNVENTKGKYGRQGDLPKKWAGFPVLDADKHDFRFLDVPGTVSGLRAKAEAQYASTDFGFVIQPDDEDLDPNDPAVRAAKKYLQEFERKIQSKQIQGPGRYIKSMKAGAEQQDLPYYLH